MRVVSLVPSLTETLFGLGLGPDEIVGRTSWCLHPGLGVREVPDLGGTKTPKLARIKELRPDLVLLDREENRREAWEALQEAGIPCWVASATTVGEIPALLEDLGRTVGRADTGGRLADELRSLLALADATVAELGPGPRALPLIWHDPLMALAPTRYGGDVVRRCGFTVPDPEPGVGYPVVTPHSLAALNLDLLLLTSEPHDFSIAEGEVIADAIRDAGGARPEPVKVDGEALTWFGVRSAAGVAAWCSLRRRYADPRGVA